jgi:uncharacterized protein
MRILILYITLMSAVLLGAPPAYAQNKLDDINLLKKKNCSIEIGDNNYRHEIKTNNCKPITFKHKNIFAKYNPLSLSAKGAMLFYQYIVAPQFFRYCLYERSCSNFSKKAIEEFGLVKGVFLSADRLLRCNVLAMDEISSFDYYGYAIDEPWFYRIKKK